MNMGSRVTDHSLQSLAAGATAPAMSTLVKPVAKLEEPGGFLFYAGGLSRPQWSRSEDSAVLLFCAGSVGELWFAGTRAGSLDMPLQRRLASR
jgi:hypothetical protein